MTLSTAISALETSAPETADAYVAFLTSSFLAKPSSILRAINHYGYVSVIESTISHRLCFVETRLRSAINRARSGHWTSSHDDLFGLMALRDALLEMMLREKGK